jgi:hypothetical protein
VPGRKTDSSVLKKQHMPWRRRSDSMDNPIVTVLKLILKELKALRKDLKK